MVSPGGLVVVHEANRFCGFAMVAEETGTLKDPAKRVCAPQIPVPVAPTHEKIFKPSPEDVVLAVREAMGKRRAHGL